MEEILSNHKIILDSRKSLQMTGIQKVESTNNNQIVCVAMGCPLIITGKNMHIKKLDVSSGIVDVEGQIDSIKYEQKKQPFLKRIFR